MTLAFQPFLRQRYLNAFRAQLFTLILALSFPQFGSASHTCANVSLALTMACSHGGRALKGACRQIIHVNSVHKTSVVS